MVTVEADTNNTECGNNNSGETYCVAQQQTNNLGEVAKSISHNVEFLVVKRLTES